MTSHLGKSSLMPIAAVIRKGVQLKLLAAALLCFFLFPQLVFSASVRIMPLGDSITNGSSSGVVPDSQQYYLSYRKALRDKLTDRGYQINYVGSQVSGDAIFSDAQHEGHGGWVADGGPAGTSIAPNVYNFLEANPADIVLLHIGTNDVGAGHASADDVRLILDEIDRYSPSVWVVLALIINQATPPCPLCTTTTAYNDALDAMVRTRPNDKIVIVDMENGAGLDYRLYPSGDMYDTLHPYARGYEKMAEAWLFGLLDILPTADAGTDQDVNPGNAVTLNGSGSTDTLGTIVSYAWVQTGGSPTVTLANANTTQAQFTAPDTSTGSVLTFKLSITDDKGFTHSDSCVVNVNGRPVADAGTDQQVQSGATVTLDGSGSTDGGDGALAYAWGQTSGPAVALFNPSSVRPSFQAPTAGAAGATLTFQLTVTDSGGLQSVDSCTVTVSPQQEGGASGSSGGGGGGGGGCFITAAGQ
jgi:lysophospholipase L1-like esterase